MNSNQFHKLAHGTHVQFGRNGDLAYGTIVSHLEYNSRGSLITYNRIKVTEAPADSMWAKYVKRPAQAGLGFDFMQVER